VASPLNKVVRSKKDKKGITPESENPEPRSQSQDTNQNQDESKSQIQDVLKTVLETGNDPGLEDEDDAPEDYSPEGEGEYPEDEDDKGKHAPTSNFANPRCGLPLRRSPVKPQESSQVQLTPVPTPKPKPIPVPAPPPVTEEAEDPEEEITPTSP